MSLSKKKIVYPNKKPWMNNKIKQLLRAKDTAFKSGNTSVYRVTRVNLKRGIRFAKLKYKLQIEEDFDNNSVRCLAISTLDMARYLINHRLQSRRMTYNTR